MIRSRKMLALVLALAGIVSSCAIDDIATQDVRSATVVIEARGCSLVAARGTGVAIGRSGTIVTVAHTIAGATSIEVIDSAGRTSAAVVKWFDPAVDLAVLTVPGFSGDGLDVARASPGERVLITTSSPGESSFGIDARISRFISVTIEDIYFESIVHRHGIELTADVVKGDSGAAVVNAHGRVVGIIYARSRNSAHLAFALDDLEINRALSAAIDGEMANGRCT